MKTSRSVKQIKIELPTISRQDLDRKNYLNEVLYVILIQIYDVPLPLAFTADR